MSLAWESESKWLGDWEVNREGSCWEDSNFGKNIVLEPEGISSNPTATATKFVTYKLQNFSLTFLLNKR